MVIVISVDIKKEVITMSNFKFKVDIIESERGWGQKYYHVVRVGELPRIVCDQIQNLYQQAGWVKAHCRTSSENGERGGLTGLQLFKTIENDDKDK